jgi:hypothetical protein
MVWACLTDVGAAFGTRQSWWLTVGQLLHTDHPPVV